MLSPCVVEQKIIRILEDESDVGCWAADAVFGGVGACIHRHALAWNGVRSDVWRGFTEPPRPWMMSLDE